MGFREAVLLGFVFLLLGANLCAATQNWLNSSTNETISQIPHEQVTASLQLPRPPQKTDHQSNRTGHSGPVRPVSYQLKTYRLRNPAVSKQKPLGPLVEQMQTFDDPQSSEARELTSEQLELRETVQAPELIKLLVQGPDLNPPVKPESKVLFIFYDFHAAFLIFYLTVIKSERCSRCW